MLQQKIDSMQQKIEYLRFRAKQSFTDYCVRSRSLPPHSVEATMLLTRGEFERLYLTLCGIDPREQSIAFKSRIANINQTIKRAQRKYYHGSFNRTFFQSVYAMDARQEA
jgi:hypothetical protein